MPSTHTEITGRVYRFDELLGIGGFGTVYRATLDTGGVATEVAVKLLRSHVAEGSQAVERLRDEARFLAALNHPSVLRIVDLVELDGRLALVTEYLDGLDLRRMLKRSGPMPQRATFEVVARVADALDAAFNSEGPHGAPMRLIHRDIKPANIFLLRHGNAKLLDFGVARSDVFEREAHTATYALVGSGTYAAPESLMRETLTPASDVWSLGLTTYEMLTGQQLFADMELKDLARLIVKGDPAEFLAKKLDDIYLPDEAMNLLRDMLATDPPDRPSPATVRDLADDLAEDLRGASLRKWARTQDWAGPRGAPEDPMVGRTVPEQALGTALQFTDAPALPDLSDADASEIGSIDELVPSDDAVRTPDVTTKVRTIPPAVKPEPSPENEQRGGGAFAALGALLVTATTVLGAGGVAAVLMALVVAGTATLFFVTREPPPPQPELSSVSTPRPKPKPKARPTKRPPPKAADEAGDDPDEDDADEADADADEEGAAVSVAGAAPRRARSSRSGQRSQPTRSPDAAPDEASEPEVATAEPEPEPQPEVFIGPARERLVRGRARRVKRDTPGMLHIRSNLKAQVQLDGKVIGYTPVDIQVSPEVHHVVTIVPGHASSRTRSTVLPAPGQEVELQLTFQ